MHERVWFASSQTYHFSNLAILETSSVVRKQSQTISDGTESRYIGAVPDDIVQSVVVSCLHASELVVRTETITAELLGQNSESRSVRRVDLTGGARLSNNTGDDGVFGVGVTVRVRGVTSSGLAPEDHVVWVAACGVSVRSTTSRKEMDVPESFYVIA